MTYLKDRFTVIFRVDDIENQFDTDVDGGYNKRKTTRLEVFCSTSLTDSDLPFGVICLVFSVHSCSNNCAACSYTLCKNATCYQMHSKKPSDLIRP